MNQKKLTKNPLKRPSIIFIIAFFIASNTFCSAQDSKKSVQLFNKGMVFLRQANNKEALKFFDAAVNADSMNFDARIKRGFVKGLEGDFQGEIIDYTQIISISPEHKWSYISRSGAYNRVGKYEEAIADANKVIEIDPQNSEAYNNRGFSKKGLGDKEGACQDWSKSKKMGNSEANIILKNNLCK
jgi:tetratricopeptide (TPR) repeat protein